MRDVAWVYGHEKQILLDGTFGVCDSRVLLFILMGIDKQRKGVPLAFLLFSAPSGNSFKPSGYDHYIETASEMEDSLERNTNTPYSPAIAITDTDYKERKALLAVFPDTVHVALPRG